MGSAYRASGCDHDVLQLRAEFQRLSVELLCRDRRVRDIPLLLSASLQLLSAGLFLRLHIAVVPVLLRAGICSVLLHARLVLLLEAVGARAREQKQQTGREAGSVRARVPFGLSEIASARSLPV